MKKINSLTHGFLLIDKPPGISCAFITNKIKWLLQNQVKVGHAGTLDPFASGLLIVGIGRQATKHMSHLQKLDKQYEATICFGKVTNTFDINGMVVEQDLYVPQSEDEIIVSINTIGKSYEQIPPIYSALKFQGAALYKMARLAMVDQDTLHEIVALKKRRVQIYSAQLKTYTAPHATIFTHVSHGTYIRSYMDDIAKGCNSRATTMQLVRKTVGPYLLSDALSFTSTLTQDFLLSQLISTELFLQKIDI